MKLKIDTGMNGYHIGFSLVNWGYPIRSLWEFDIHLIKLTIRVCFFSKDV